MPVSIAHAKSLSHADLTGTITVNNSSGGTQTAMATDLMRPGDWNSAHAATLQITPAEQQMAELVAQQEMEQAAARRRRLKRVALFLSVQD